MADYQTIVIGSGAGGLSAALTLARQGFSVLLLEAMGSFGGYLNPFRRGGYTFDTGLHYLGQLGKGEYFSRLLDKLGIADRIDFVELNPDGFDRYIFPDFEIAMCKGKDRYKERLKKKFPRENNGIDKYFDLLDKMLKAMRASMSGKGTLGMLGFLMKHPVMLKYGRATYQDLLDDVTKDKHLQAVLAAHSGTYGLPPARASAIIAVAVLSSYLNGAYYPKGGSGAFRDAFVDGLKEHRAEMRKKARVVRIDKKGRDFVVKTETGEEYSAKVIVSNVDPVITLGQLVNRELVPPKTLEKVNRLKPSIGAFYAFIGTDLDLPSLGISDANIHHFDEMDMNKLYEIGKGSYLRENVPGFFITSPSVKDPERGHAPKGRHTLEIVTMVDYESFEKWSNKPSMKRGEEYVQFKNRIGDRLIKAAERYIPGLSKHLDHVELATPLSNAYWVNAVRGGCYGPEQTPDQMGPGRFSSFTSGIDGLFLVGAGTTAGGISPCIASGIAAGKMGAVHLGT